MVGKTTEDLMAALTKGPVSIGVDAGLFQSYSSGVIKNKDCGSTMDHGVQVVGQTKDTWIVRNSWGPSWGLSGFILLEKGPGLNTCGLLNNAVYPTLGGKHSQPGPHNPPSPVEKTCDGHCDSFVKGNDGKPLCWCKIGCKDLKNCCPD